MDPHGLKLSFMLCYLYQVALHAVLLSFFCFVIYCVLWYCFWAAYREGLLQK